MPKNPTKKPNNSNKPLYPSKDYKKWSKLKSQINNNVIKYHTYRESYVYWVNLGENIGVEEDGKSDAFSRPAIIVRGFSRNLVWIVPLSHTKRTGEYYYPFTLEGKYSNALLSQLRSVDAARIGREVLGKVDFQDFKEICTRLQSFLDIQDDAALR